MFFPGLMTQPQTENFISVYATKHERIVCYHKNGKEMILSRSPLLKRLMGKEEDEDFNDYLFLNMAVSARWDLQTISTISLDSLVGRRHSTHNRKINMRVRSLKLDGSILKEYWLSLPDGYSQAFLGLINAYSPGILVNPTASDRPMFYVNNLVQAMSNTDLPESFRVQQEFVRKGYIGQQFSGETLNLVYGFNTEWREINFLTPNSISGPRPVFGYNVRKKFSYVIKERGFKGDWNGIKGEMRFTTIPTPAYITMGKYPYFYGSMVEPPEIEGPTDPFYEIELNSVLYRFNVKSGKRERLGKGWYAIPEE
jgi:hypothetical protein